MNKVRKKFVLYAMIAVFVLLTVLLSVINAINFTMMADDADRVTEMIASGKGAFPGEMAEPPRDAPRSGQMNRMGPDSPEIAYSARYFTFRFDKDGNAEEVTMNISAFKSEEAREIASSLVKDKNKTGWLKFQYRYRVYKNGDFTYVTVVDQGRELLPSYRILIISLIGEALCLAVCFAFLAFMSGKLLRPIEEADRRQKEFLSEAENEFKIPLTVINANTEIIEKEIGTNEHTQSINRQVKKMIKLTKKLGTLSLVAPDGEAEPCDLSLTLSAAIDRARGDFETRGIEVSSEVIPGETVSGDAESIRKAVGEIVANSAKFAKTHASFKLNNGNGRVSLTASNDTDLQDGSADRVFDRFTRLENADGVEGNGLGLSFVKDVVKAQNGRLTAKVVNGEFTLRIAL